jgi:hypothetical protein
MAHPATSPRRAKRSYGLRIRIRERRSEPSKYVFKDGRVRMNDNPFALLRRREQDEAKDGVVRLVSVPVAAPSKKRRQA